MVERADGSAQEYHALDRDSAFKRFIGERDAPDSYRVVLREGEHILAYDTLD